MLFKHYIEKYVNNLTINDVYDYAFKNNVSLTQNEANLIYRNIKDNWKTIIYSDHYIVLNRIKDQLNQSTYLKLEELINFNKNKYKSYI